MARKIETQKTFNIAVVGLSGTEKDKGSMGTGKSCLCNRFVRPFADDYHTDHISVLSQSDFNGRVVNNDHWLYWGEVSKVTDEGIELNFSVIEQTEFMDDACFQSFKGGKTEPYYRRCASTRLCSAEKLMYICKNQLGIEIEYEQKYLHDGRFNVDGFVCIFDVSEIQGRSLEKSVEMTALILSNLMKTKKPVVLATTKQDEGSEIYIREAERLVNRKDFRGYIPMIETSAHENVNVDLPFIVCAQLIDRTKGRAKMLSFHDAMRFRKECMDYANETFQALIRMNITDYRSAWHTSFKKLSPTPEFITFCDLFGQDAAHMAFKRHTRKLKEDYIGRKMQMYMRILPEVLSELVPDLDAVGEICDWETVKHAIKSHPDLDQYFVENPPHVLWHEIDLNESNDTRIPLDLLETPEAEQCFLDHKRALEGEDRRRDLRQQFKQLLMETGYVTPGKLFNEVRVLFMGRECYESLSEQDLIEIYEEHQKEITDRAKANFQELLQEHSELFYHFASLGPGSVITQDDIFKITETLAEDVRYKALDRLEQDRTLMLLRHLGFIHGPIREHCPAYPDCMDVLIEKTIPTKAKGRHAMAGNRQWFANESSTYLSIVILGSGGLGEELAAALRKVNETFEVDDVRYTLDFRIIEGDVDLPQNAFNTSEFSPQGCFCIYSNHQTLEYVRESFEKTLLSNLEEEENRLPFHGLPIVLLFSADANTSDAEIALLREEGEKRATSLQCPFIDVTTAESERLENNGALSGDSQSLESGLSGEHQERWFSEECLSRALRALLESVQRKGYGQIYQTASLPEKALNPDLRLLMCFLCGDPFTVESVIGSFLNHQYCYVTSVHSVAVEVTIGDSKKFVELIFTSYHGAQAYRDELLHGFILVYSAKRQASLATLSAFSNNIPNTPTQILAVTEASTSNSVYYSNNELALQLVAEGSAIADKLQVHFMSSNCQQRSSFFVPFLAEVWERKPQIEKAFDLDGSDYSLERTTPLPGGPPPLPLLAARLDAFASNDRVSEAEVDGIYEQLPSADTPSSPYELRGAPLSPSDDSEIYASVLTPNGDENNGGVGDEQLVKPSQLRNRRSLQAGYGAYPPPEPAPPDYHAQPNLLRSGPSITASGFMPLVQRSFDEGWVDNRVFDKEFDRNLRPGEEWLDNDVYQAYQSEQRMKMPLNARQPKPKPGKLNLKQFDNITDAVGRLNISQNITQRQGTLPKSHGLAEGADYPPDYVHDALYDGQEYPYSGGQNVLSETKGQRVRSLARRKDNSLEKGSDSESDCWSSPDRRQPRAGEVFAGRAGSQARKLGAHKKLRKKRGIPVAPPKLPFLEGPSSAGMFVASSAGASSSPFQTKILNASAAGQARDEALDSYSASDVSNGEGDALDGNEELRAKPLPRLSRPSPATSRALLDGVPSPQSPTSSPFAQVSSERVFPAESAHLSYSSSSSKLRIDTGLQSATENDFDASPKEATIRQLGMILKSKSAGVVTENDKSRERKEKKKSREDEKLEKRRLKEEERQRRLTEKKKKKQNKSSGSQSGPGLEEFIQSPSKLTPLFVEKCIEFIEEEGLDSEGIYRVPGNRAHVDLLFQKFDEDAHFSIRELDVPVNAAATALKDFFSKRLPPLIPPVTMDELTDIATIQERSARVMALRELVRKLPPINFAILKFVFQHFVKVTANSRLNSMDSKNLAICWWPTLLPFEFNDMMMFERMRPHLEESVQTMIDQFKLLFCDESEVLMV